MNFKVLLIIFLISDLFFSFDLIEITAEEYDLKAVFLYNFIKYFEWEGIEEKEYFEIVIFGESPIYEPLNEIAKKKLVFGKTIRVKNLMNVEEINYPQIIFISKNSTKKFKEIYEKFFKYPVLIIGEEEGLCEKGASINFVIREGLLKFEINQDSLREAGLKASSQLLKLSISNLKKK